MQNKDKRWQFLKPELQHFVGGLSLVELFCTCGIPKCIRYACAKKLDQKYLHPFEHGLFDNRLVGKPIDHHVKEKLNRVNKIQIFFRNFYHKLGALSMDHCVFRFPPNGSA